MVSSLRLTDHLVAGWLDTGRVTPDCCLRSPPGNSATNPPVGSDRDDQPSLPWLGRPGMLRVTDSTCRLPGAMPSTTRMAMSTTMPRMTRPAMPRTPLRWEVSAREPVKSPTTASGPMVCPHRRHFSGIVLWVAPQTGHRYFAMITSPEPRVAPARRPRTPAGTLVRPAHPGRPPPPGPPGRTGCPVQGWTRILAWASGSARAWKAPGTPSRSTRPVTRGDTSISPSAIRRRVSANSSGS